MAPARTSNAHSTPDSFAISIPQVPVTEQRLPYIHTDGEASLVQPGTARANIAASVEAPNGTEKDGYAGRYKNQTVLQQHCAFFDTDGDMVIWPRDTYRGFSLLGYNVFLCILSMVIIHANFSYPTGKSWIPDPFFRVYVERIHKDKHGSDSGTYDNEGRFVPQKFEDIFEKYALADPKRQSIDKAEVWNYMSGQRVIMDPIGWFGAFFEWIATYILLWPEDGRMKKEDIRRIYDGSLFFEVAERREREKKRKFDVKVQFSAKRT